MFQNTFGQWSLQNCCLRCFKLSCLSQLVKNTVTDVTKESAARIGQLRCLPQSLCLLFCRVWDLWELRSQFHAVPNTQAVTLEMCFVSRQSVLRVAPLCGSVFSYFGGKDEMYCSSTPLFSEKEDNVLNFMV